MTEADNNGKELFGEYYFAHNCGRPYQRDEHWLGFFGTIAERIVRDIQPASVLDAGCAMGFLVEALRARGVDAWGVDISTFAIDNVHADIRDYCWQGSVLDPFPQDYELIICIEVLEHLEAPDSEKALKNICDHSEDVIFSSSPADFQEATHLNVQPAEYWAELFAHQSFFRDVDFDGSFITPWAARFRRIPKPALHRIVRDYERPFSRLRQENAERQAAAIDLQNQVSALEEQVAHLRQAVQDRDAQIFETRNQLETVLNSRSWRMVTRVQRIADALAPPGSGRARFFKRLLSALGFQGGPESDA